MLGFKLHNNGVQKRQMSCISNLHKITVLYFLFFFMLEIIDPLISLESKSEGRVQSHSSLQLQDWKILKIFTRFCYSYSKKCLATIKLNYLYLFHSDLALKPYIQRECLDFLLGYLIVLANSMSNFHIIKSFNFIVFCIFWVFNLYLSQ